MNGFIDMETKEMRIKVPEGYEIDRENSTFECIKFKPKSLTYEDVTKKLFADSCYCTDLDGNIGFCNVNLIKPNRGYSIKQLKKLLAINKLMNVAKYLNGDWKPDWRNNSGKSSIYIGSNNEIRIGSSLINSTFVYFKSRQFA